MTYRWFVVARVIHLLGIVVWIGGLATVTTVIFPTMRRIDSNEQKAWLWVVFGLVLFIVEQLVVVAALQASRTWRLCEWNALAVVWG